MQDKELEKILQEKADNTKIRDFSEVWEEIKDEIVPQKKEKKSILKNKFFLTFAPTLLIICIALTPLIIKSLTPLEEVFYTDKLNKQQVTVQEMYDGLLQENITHVDLSKYSFISTSLYVTEELEVKGGYVEFFNENPTTFLAKMKFANVSDDLVNVRVGKEMYQRRGGIKYFKSEAKLQKYMLEHKIIGMSTYLLNISKRLIVQVLLPNKLRGWVFKKFARKTVS